MNVARLAGLPTSVVARAATIAHQAEVCNCLASVGLQRLPVLRRVREAAATCSGRWVILRHMIECADGISCRQLMPRGSRRQHLKKMAQETRVLGAMSATSRRRQLCGRSASCWLPMTRRRLQLPSLGCRPASSGCLYQAIE